MIPSLSTSNHFTNIPQFLSRKCRKITDIACKSLNATPSLANFLPSRGVISTPKRIPALLVFSALWGRVHGQDTFLKSFGGTIIEQANALTIDASGNIVVAGYTNSFGAGGEDVLLAKWDASGSLSWAKTLGGTSDDRAYALAVDASGDIITAGSTKSFGAGNEDILLAKWNASGSLSWAKTLGGTDIDRAYALAVDTSKNILAAGLTLSVGAGYGEIFLAKWNASGSLSWAKTLGGNSYEYINALAFDASGNIVGLGVTSSFGAGNDDVLLAKWDTSGTLSWVKTLGGTSYDLGIGLAIAANGNIFATGVTYSFGAGNDDVLLAKWNATGTLSWAKTLGGTNYERANALSIDANGNIVTLGYTGGFGAGSYDFFLSKWDTNGTLGWAKTIGGTSNDRGYALRIDSSNNYFLAGIINDNILLGRMNSDGTMYNCSYVQTVSPTVITQTGISTSTPSATNASWTTSTQLSWTSVSVSTISSGTQASQCLPFTTTGVATTGVATTGIPTTGVATTGIATTGLATTGIETTGVATTGVATTGIVTTGMGTTGIATTGVGTTGEATTGVATTGVMTTGQVTTGHKPPGVTGAQSTTSKTSGESVPPPGRQTNDVGLALGLTFGLGIPLAALGALGGCFLWRRKQNERRDTNVSSEANPHSQYEMRVRQGYPSSILAPSPQLGHRPGPYEIVGPESSSRHPIPASVNHSEPRYSGVPHPGSPSQRPGPYTITAPADSSNHPITEGSYDSHQSHNQGAYTILPKSDSDGTILFR